MPPLANSGITIDTATRSLLCSGALGLWGSERSSEKPLELLSPDTGARYASDQMPEEGSERRAVGESLRIPLRLWFWGPEVTH